MVKSGDEPTLATSDEIAKLRHEFQGMEDRLMHAIEQARVQAYRTERNVIARLEESCKSPESSQGK